MSKAIIGKKIGMTQVFAEDGKVIPVTVVEAGPCTVVQKKTVETDGYNTYVISFDYRVDGEITEDTEYFLAFYDVQTNSQRDPIYFKPEASENGEVRHAEITFEPVADDQVVLTLLIGCRRAPGTIIIDNLKIEQFRQT